MIDVKELVDNELEEIIIDQTKLDRMKKRIFELEKSNSKTSEFGEKEIKEKIKKIIEEELEKCY